MSELRLGDDGRTVDPRVCPYLDHYGDDRHHSFVNNSSSCTFCGITQQTVRDQFRDWRYETVVADLTRAVEQLTYDVRRLR